MDVLSAVLELLAGIGVFLFACMLLSQNIEAVTGKKLRNLFRRSSEKKLVGLSIGAVTTAAVQSSGATSVLIMGFVNAGLMSLTLASAMIYGANIGTTVTGIIVSLGMLDEGSLSLITIFSALTGIGAFLAVYSKQDRRKKIGLILTAFGLLFVGLGMMKDAMDGFAEMPDVQQAIGNVHNLIILVIIGIVLTAIVQSSSVMMTVCIAMLQTGLIDLQQGIYMAIGTNIGSTVVALLASQSVGRDAKRIAVVHLLFNVFGVIMFVVAGFIMRMQFDIGYAEIMMAIFGSSTPGQAMGLAVFDLLFNIIVAIVMMPLTGRLLALSDRIVPRKEGGGRDGPHFFFIDERMLGTPVVAIGGVKKEIVKMLDIAFNNVERARKMVIAGEVGDMEDFAADEKQLNFMNKKLTQFITKLSNNDLSERDRAYISTAYRSIMDIEAIGDYAEGMTKYVSRLQNTGEYFSPAAKGSIDRIFEALYRLYSRVIDAYISEDRNKMKYAHQMEDIIDDMVDSMGQEHAIRLSKGECSPNVGPEFLMLISDLERVQDLLYNVAKSVKSITAKPPRVENKQSGAAAS